MLKQTWNTCSPLGINRIIHIPSYIELRIGFWHPASKTFYDRYSFAYQPNKNYFKGFGINNFQPQAIEKYTGQIVQVEARPFELVKTSLTLAGKHNHYLIDLDAYEDRLSLQFTLKELKDEEEQILIFLDSAWKHPSQHKFELEGVLTQCEGNYAFFTYNTIPDYRGSYTSQEAFREELTKDNKLNNIIGEPTQLAALSFSLIQPLQLTYCLNKNPEKARNIALEYLPEVEQIFISKFERDEEPYIATNEIRSLSDSLNCALTWNICWDETNKDYYLPVTKSEIEYYYNAFAEERQLPFLQRNIHKVLKNTNPDNNYQGPFYTPETSAVNILLLSLYQPEWAKKIIHQQFALQTKDGRLPMLTLGKMSTGGSGFPLLAHTIWKLYLKTNDKTFLKEIYPSLKRWYLWFKKERDRNLDNLFEWGNNDKMSSLFNFPIEDLPDKIGAAYESGFYDSPLWEGENNWDKKKHCLTTSCVGLSSFISYFANLLSLMAEQLEHTEESKTFKAEHINYNKLINKHFWDNTRKVYVNVHWNGKRDKTLTASSFYPLLAKVTTLEDYNLLVKHYLSEANSFWAEYGIPSLDMEHSKFDGNSLGFRGALWPHINYLIHTAIKQYDPEKAHQLLEKFLWLYEQHWEQNHSLPGCFDPNKATNLWKTPSKSISLSTTGALFGLAYLESLIDVQLEGKGLNFGNPFLERDVEFRNFIFQNIPYTIIAGTTQTTLKRRNQEVFSCYPGALIRNYQISREEVIFEIWANKDIAIFVKEFPKNKNILLGIGGGVPKPIKTRPEVTFNISFSKYGQTKTVRLYLASKK